MWARLSGYNLIQRMRSSGQAGKRKALIVVPVAFVSEHSETLVELDIEYAELAEKSGVSEYIRVPTVNATDAFIDALTKLVIAAPETGTVAGGEICAGWVQ